MIGIGACDGTGIDPSRGRASFGAGAEAGLVVVDSIVYGAAVGPSEAAGKGDVSVAATFCAFVVPEGIGETGGEFGLVVVVDVPVFVL